MNFKGGDGDLDVALKVAVVLMKLFLGIVPLIWVRLRTTCLFAT